jgi:4-hydroxy-4-methyl-2-oxoglutarate aldolase
VTSSKDWPTAEATALVRRSSIRQRLGRLDACAVSDALDRADLPGAVSGITSLSVRRRVYGPVCTVKLTEPQGARGSGDGPPRHLGTTAIASALPGTVIVVEQRTGIEAAGWGGLLTRGAVMAGIAGVIVEGWARDLDEAIDHAFPVYARGSTTRTARGRIAEAATGVDILVADVPVRSGDWVVADASGIVFIADRNIEIVIGEAEVIMARESVMAYAVLSGIPITDVMGATYETLLERRG